MCVYMCAAFVHVVPPLGKKEGWGGGGGGVECVSKRLLLLPLCMYVGMYLCILLIFLSVSV